MEYYSIIPPLCQEEGYRTSVRLLTVGLPRKEEPSEAAQVEYVNSAVPVEVCALQGYGAAAAEEPSAEGGKV